MGLYWAIVICLFASCAPHFPSPHLTPSKGITEEQRSDKNANRSQAKHGNSTKTVIVDDKRATSAEKRNPGDKVENPWPWDYLVSQRWVPTVLVLSLIVTLFAWRTNALRNALERPWLMFKPERPATGPDDPANPPILIWPLPATFDPINNKFYIGWNLINVGRSPAFLIQFTRYIRLLPKEEYPPKPTKGKASFTPLIISPKGPPEDRFGNASQLILGPDSFNALRDGNSRVWLYGIATYRGSGWRRFTTKFCCRWYFDSAKNEWTYEPVGPEGWTKYT